jgi:uncharacterized protein
MIKKTNTPNFHAVKHDFMGKEALMKEALIVKKQISIIGSVPRNKIKLLPEQRKKKLNSLKALGFTVRNDGMSVYLNRLSPGCVDCSRGTALTVAATARCNRNCFFCLSRGIHKQKLKLVDTITKIYKCRNYILSLAITGGECLLDLVATIEILEFAKELAGDICQTRVYTNGDMLSRSVLKKLQAARLEEIRISIKPDTDFKKIALAKEYVPRVMVETPVFPGNEEDMQGVLIKLNKLKIFGVNLVELIFPCRNAHLYKRKGYRLITDTINELSMPYSYSYPIYGSEMSCFDLLEFAARNNFSIGVHYCSQDNERYGNSSERLQKREIGKNLKLDFTKYKKLNKERLALKLWPGAEYSNA